MTRILFVCTGNICRSPTAEGVARHFIETSGLGGRVEVDSAGTHGYHVGEAPDPRTQKAAKQRGYDLSALRARKLELRDFQEFDLLLAMDRGHLDIMQRKCPEVYQPRLGLFMAFAGEGRLADEVPDPYYGGPRGFDVVLDMCEDAVRGLLDSVSSRV
ncbi:low molecular weight protein-tyrosine-phosphatase [Thauera sp.]|uniref:low molecular weight protein-tyrosine-phosphatase n=1 Tax=Thauera sp. TaxID=1905334 RepID=UPI002C537DE6|nr:low molecular weight protein-tyrosine-phosphatase [Thauera sp.]HRP23366.1 low molecular weight protein-tyrosine-phosphatase [Thauera sp.]